MSPPICDICANSGILCSACEKKLQEGRITQLEVDLSQILYKLTSGEVSFDGAIELDNVVIIFVEKKDIGKIIGKKGVNIKKLSKKLNKQVRVVGTGDIREAICDFIAPAKVKEINRVYQPDGAEIQRVKIDIQDQKKLRMKPEEIKKIITALTNTKVELVFE